MEMSEQMQHFRDIILKCSFLKDNLCIMIQIAKKFVPRVQLPKI